MNDELVVRTMRPGEFDAMRMLSIAAFSNDLVIGELLGALRDSWAWDDDLSFVAEHDGELVGHVLYTHAILDAPARLVDVLLLSPIGVRPDRQLQGVGRELITRSLGVIEQRSEPLVFLEGHSGLLPALRLRSRRRPGIRLTVTPDPPRSVHGVPAPELRALDDRDTGVPRRVLARRRRRPPRLRTTPERSGRYFEASWMARHTRSDVQGMSTWVTPRWLSASTTALWIAGVDPIVPDSPMPLAPSGLRGLSVWVFDTSKLQQLGRRRDGVVDQRRGERVAVVVVLHPLVQRLRGALRDAAVLLAGDEQRVQDATAVVDGDVAQHRDLAGLGVDLDHRHVRAERERRVGAVEVELVAQRRGLETVGQLRRVARRRRPARPTTAPRPARRPRAGRRSPTTMSSGDASSRWPAIWRARSSTSLDATWIALPAVCSEREPIVPAPRGTRSVSELTSVILSIGMPSTSLASIANAV